MVYKKSDYFRMYAAGVNVFLNHDFFFLVVFD